MEKKIYKMMDWPRIEAVCYSEEDRPHDFLGIKFISGGALVQCFFPQAETVSLMYSINGKNKECVMDIVDEMGFFVTFIKTTSKNITYKYKITDENGKISECLDPYCYECTIPVSELEKFNQGINYEIYKYLGSHVMTVDGVKGTSFAVWAPNAIRVSVVGDFNSWDGRVYQMRRIADTGVFEIFIPGVLENTSYKYEIKIKGGLTMLKADPYAFYSELRPDTASKVFDISGFKWTDDDFVSKKRFDINSQSQPICVYEVYLGSIDRAKDNSYLDYEELADKLILYVKKMGYTHVELMPVMEHPLDASWGYQVIGYFAPTSRYGTPLQFKSFINKMHEAGIGVILDWVPAHFPKDAHGLCNFDGTCLYEHSDPRRANHPHWGTLCYNYGRAEVSNYLISNALFWINEYHADGIRMDAVASMLYLDYGKNDGEWVANQYGGKEHLEAIEMLKHLNSINEKMNTGAMIIAEESTAWPLVTGNLEDNGLGFNLKWNMGWMNDFLDFIRLDPMYRGGHYNELTFSMIYAFCEKFMLVFSHDEVVHGKSSLIGKMPGDRYDKFANMRLAFAYMYFHPGKKLNFMGCEIGEFEEWNENRRTNYELLKYDEHKEFNNYIVDLIKFYKSTPALYELDDSCDGFEWINNFSANETIIVFLRKDKKGNNLLFVMNFANVARTNYKIGVPFNGKYKEIFCSDMEKYGGSDILNSRVKMSKKDECDSREYSIKIKIAPLSVSVFSCTQVKEDCKK